MECLGAATAAERRRWVGTTAIHHIPRETADAAAGRAVVDLRAPRPKLALPLRGADVAHEGVVLAVAASVAAVVVVRKILGGRGAKAMRLL